MATSLELSYVGVNMSSGWSGLTESVKRNSGIDIDGGSYRAPSAGMIAFDRRRWRRCVAGGDERVALILTFRGDWT